MKIGIATSLFWAAALICTSASESEESFGERHRRMQQEHERRMAESEKRFQEARSRIKGSASGLGNYGSQPGTNRPHTFSQANTFASGQPASSSYGSSYATKAASASSGFIANQAPAPGGCFLKMVETANSAATMSQLMPFLPQAEVKRLEEEQASYNPAQAQERRLWFKKQEPTMTEESLTHLTESPYDRELKFLKRIASHVMRVARSSINGNIAKLSVATRGETRARFNGGQWENFPYGTATVEMIGEGNYWRFKSYNDSPVKFKTPQ